MKQPLNRYREKKAYDMYGMQKRLCEQESGGVDQVSLVLQWFWLCLDVWLHGKRKDVHNKI